MSAARPTCAPTLLTSHAGAFIKILYPKASVFKTWEYSLLNAAVSLVGYYFAALLVDYKLYGRRTMQMVGFAASFILYLFSAIFYEKLQEKGAPIHWFQFMYFMSSFFTQFGANCTTFLVAAESYPASIRGTAHGFSAASGKVGALIPTVVFNYLNGRDKFWFCTCTSLLLSAEIATVWLTKERLSLGSAGRADHLDIPA